MGYEDWGVGSAGAPLQVETLGSGEWSRVDGVPPGQSIALHEANRGPSHVDLGGADTSVCRAPTARLP